MPTYSEPSTIGLHGSNLRWESDWLGRSNLQKHRILRDIVLRPVPKVDYPTLSPTYNPIFLHTRHMRSPLFGGLVRTGEETPWVVLLRE